MKHLFMINIGGSTDHSNIEVHDIVFEIAESIEDAYEGVKKTWYGTKDSLHIDSYKRLSNIDDYTIEFSEEEQTTFMYMVIYGGHKPGEFSESHRIHFVVAKSIYEAKSKGKSELYRFEFMDHIDSVCDVQKAIISNPSKLKLIEADVEFDESPDWHGYIVI